MKRSTHHEAPTARGEHAPAAAPHGGHHAEAGPGHDHHAGMLEDFQRRLRVCLALTLPIMALSPMLQQWAGLAERWRFPGDQGVLFALSSLVFFYGGWPFLKGMVEEVRGRRVGMMTLIAVAITTAYAYSAAVVLGLPGMGFFWELATLIDIMLLGHWIEMRSVMGAGRALEALARLVPAEAHLVEPDGRVREVPSSELQPGDHVLVRPGEKVPADGRVYEGASSMNEAMLTGESRPVAKEEGDTVIGGALNGEGAVRIEVGRTGRDSYLAQVIALVEAAQASKSRTQDLADRAALWLTAIALGGGGLTLFAWLVVMKSDLAFALERAVTVMVITCPHALGLAVPLVVALSTALSAQNGLLIRNRTAFEAARDLGAVVFDKTGTLTEGAFGVTDTLVYDDALSAQDLLRLAASIEALSEHPIARGVVRSAPAPAPVDGFRALPGRGAEGTVEGRQVQVVSPAYAREHGLAGDDPRISALASQGKTVVFVLVEGRNVGAIALADLIRPESKEALARLKAMGIRSIMLTGDNRRVAAWVAAEVGIDEVMAEVLPQDKAARVKAIQARGLKVAMTGDGVNDAPALAQADVGIAIGAGTDVALETADIVLVRSDPRDVVAVIGLARATYRKMVQNLAWATGYNVVAIPLAAGVAYHAGVLLSPAAGAVLMSLSTVIVAINARLLRLER